jgi:serine/threonine protein kinase
MGIVYLAKSIDSQNFQDLCDRERRQPSSDARVPLAPIEGFPPWLAVKTLKPHLARDPHAVGHFRKEAGHMRKLRHPSILRVLDFTQTGRGDYLVMPFMEKGSLHDLLRCGPLAEEKLHRIACQLASALAFAHSRGIIHRDLNPRNVLLDAQGHAYLTDFGLAFSLDNDSLLQPDQKRIEGSLPYLSPRAARGECEGTRSDIYALGALLYEMLSGKRPYAGATRDELLQNIEKGPPRSLVSLNPKAPASLVRIVERAMKRELDERYADMSYMLADLERARPQSASPALSRPLKIHLKSENGARTTVVLFLRRLLSLRDTSKGV